MGIKCYCPQGHVLDVKAHQAGKRGKCPKCGAKFRIPDLADPPGEGGGAESSGMAAESDSGASSKARTTSAPRSVSPSPSAAAAKPVVWYVRTREGQFGPTNEASVRDWLDDGRITTGNWLWRDGWDEWRPVETVYPELVEAPPPRTAAVLSGAIPSAAVPSGAVPSGAVPLSVAPAVSVVPQPVLSLQLDAPGATPAGRVAARRRRLAKRRWTTVVVLSVASVALLIALVYVVRSST